MASDGSTARPKSARKSVAGSKRSKKAAAAAASNARRGRGGGGGGNDDGDDGDGYLPPKMTKRILEQAREQRDEMEEDNEEEGGDGAGRGLAGDQVCVWLARWGSVLVCGGVLVSLLLAVVGPPLLVLMMVMLLLLLLLFSPRVTFVRESLHLKDDHISSQFGCLCRRGLPTQLLPHHAPRVLTSTGIELRFSIERAV